MGISINSNKHAKQKAVTDWVNATNDVLENMGERMDNFSYISNLFNERLRYIENCYCEKIDTLYKIVELQQKMINGILTSEQKMNAKQILNDINALNKICADRQKETTDTFEKMVANLKGQYRVKHEKNRRSPCGL